MLDNLKRAQDGDRSALSRIVHDQYDRVARFCARRVGEVLGRDATQETFITMQKSISKFRHESRFETWLLGIAHRTCLEVKRKNGAEPLPLEAWFEQEDHRPCPIIERESLRQALAGLSENHREVVVMHEVEGLSYAEIAEIVGIPEGTVKSRLHHPFLQLRVALRGEER